MTPPWPLSSEDGDWLALDGQWSRHEAASEIAHNLKDYWLDDWCIVNDDDTVSGWVAGYRALLGSLSRSHIRPYDETLDSERGEPDWWFECEATDRSAVSAWVFCD